MRLRLNPRPIAGAAAGALVVAGALSGMSMPAANAAVVRPAITITGSTTVRIAAAPTQPIPLQDTRVQLRSHLPRAPALSVFRSHTATNTKIGTFRFRSGAYSEVFRTDAGSFCFHRGRCVGAHRVNGKWLGVLRFRSGHTEFTARHTHGSSFAFNLPGRGWLTAHPTHGGFVQVTYTPGAFNHSNAEKWTVVAPPTNTNSARPAAHTTTLLALRTATVSPKVHFPAQIRSKIHDGPAVDIDRGHTTVNTPVGTFRFTAGARAETVDVYVLANGTYEFKFHGKCVGGRTVNGQKQAALKTCGSATHFHNHPITSAVSALYLPHFGWMSAHSGSGFKNITYVMGSDHVTNRHWRVINA